MRRCNETLVDACDTGSGTHGCCSIIPCDICVELVTDDDIFKATATWDGDEWTASVDGHEVRIFWQDLYQCELVVLFDGLEVSASPKCADYGETAADCRDPSGQVTVAVYGGEAELSWFLVVDRQIDRLPKTDTSCADHWCGNCDCLCEEICVTVRIEQDEPCLGILTLEDFYQCEVAPRWTGTVQCQDGDVEVSLTITRAAYDDEYLGIIEGDCVILAEATEVDFYGYRNPKIPRAITDVSTPTTDCPNLNFVASFEGMEITGSCLRCGECSSEIIDCGFCTFFAVTDPKPGPVVYIWTQLEGDDCELPCTCGGANSFQTPRPARTPTFFGELAYCSCAIAQPFNPGDPTSLICDEIFL
jgi:hypothetical protein